MSKVFRIIFFVLLSFVFITLQSTFFSPRHSGVFHPDLNLVLIIFLALFSEVRGGAIIALGNGYMMDVMSGYILGVHTLSRLSVFAILRGMSLSVYSQSRVIQGVAVIFGTVFSWGFIWAVFQIKSGFFEFGVSPADVAWQCVVNVLVGVPIFWMIKKVYGQIQV